MSLFSSLATVGRAVAYYPNLARFFGSVNTAILFAQLHYWHSRGGDTDLGIYKTAEDLSEETGLTYREQATARAMLRKAGFMQEVHKRLEHRVYFKLNPEAIDAAYEAWVRTRHSNDESAVPERRKRNSGATEPHPANIANRSPRSAPDATGGVRQTQSVMNTESTAESTPYISSTGADAPVGAMPAKVPDKETPPTSVDSDLQAACRATWAAYSEAYEIRYGTKPVRNAKVNAAIKGFVQRIGFDESPSVARFYVESVAEPVVLRRVHDTGLLLNGSEGYRTQWKSGCRPAAGNKQEELEARNRAAAKAWVPPEMRAGREGGQHAA